MFGDSDAITVSQVTPVGTTVRWRAAGGVDRERYVLTVRIFTSLGQVDDRSVRLRMQER